MPDNQLAKSFTGTFTWDNVGLQVADGLISEGPDFAMGMLLNGLVAQDQNMGEMFQKFADQVMEKLSVNMKEIAATKSYEDYMQQLMIRARVQEQEYNAYLTVNEQNLLDDLEEDSFDINQIAMLLQMPAIGIFCIQKVVQIALFSEKKAANPKYQQLIDRELTDAEKHIQDMYKTGIQNIDAAFTYKHRNQYGKDGELEASWVEVYYEGKLLGIADKLGKNGEPLQKDGKTSGTYKVEKYIRFETDIINPAKAIIAKLKETGTIPVSPQTALANVN